MSSGGLEWGTDSAFRDELGNLKSWYHGTDQEVGFNIFSRWDEFSIGFHFGTLEVARARIAAITLSPEEADVCRIQEVWCRAERPLVMRDLFTWSQRAILTELCDLGVIDDEVAEIIYDHCDDALILAAIERAGYDCILYGNECEHKDEITQSLIVWRAELLKDPRAASFDRNDPRLLPQFPADDGDHAAWLRWRQDLHAAHDRLAAIALNAAPAA